jgi:cysteinyl-tRNA synthetase
VAASAVVATAEPIGGPNFTLQAGTSAKGDLSGKLASDTIKPISDWIARFHDALAHQKAVDKAYDELEAARKKVTSQKDRIEKTRGQLASNPKASDRMAAEESTLQGLATKLSSAELNHTNLEAAQHARVTSLNKDAIKIRDAIRSALEATSSALTSAKDLVSTDTEPQASAAPAGTGVAGR